MRPLIGITMSDEEAGGGGRRYTVGQAYARALTEAGALAVYLPQEASQAEGYVRGCDGLVLTGGDDPDMAAFGEATHPRARLISARRQAFELALLESLEAWPETPVLGICLGMQLMGLHAGGRLDQFMPETLGEEAAEAHQGDRRHGLVLEAADSAVARSAGEAGCGGQVVSSHRQALSEAGRLRVAARSEDGVIEAVDDPSRVFFVGVQWHPERAGPDEAGFNGHLLRRFVGASRAARE